MNSEAPQNVFFQHKGQTFAIPSDRMDAIERARSLGLEEITEFEASKRKFAQEYDDSFIAPLLYGTAKGLSFGLAPGLLTKAGILEPGEAAGIEEAAPVLTTGAEIVSGIASVVGTGGIGAAGQIAGKAGAKEIAKRALAGAAAPTRRVAEVATAAGRAVGARAAATPAGTTAAKALQGAVQATAPLGIAGAIEGAAYGLGSGISEAIIQNPDATGEDILSSAANGAISGALFGGAFGGALGGVIGGTALTAQGATNLASKIYKEQIDKHGKTFADGIAKFVAGADVEAAAALSVELQDVMKFKQNYTDILNRVRTLEEEFARVEAMKQTPLQKAELAERKAIIQAEISALTEQGRLANKAINKVKSTLQNFAGQTKDSAKESRKPYVESLGKLTKQIDEAKDDLFKNHFADESVKYLDGEDVVITSEVDELIKRQLDEHFSNNPYALAKSVDLFNSYADAVEDGIRAVQREVGDAEGASVIKDYLRKVAQDRKQIQASLDGYYATQDPEKLFQYFLKQRRLRRAVNALPNEFAGQATAFKLSSNQLINAVKKLDDYTSESILGPAGNTEFARNKAIEALNKLSKELNSKNPNLKRVQSYLSVLNLSAKLSPDLAKVIQKPLSKINSLSEEVGSSVSALADHDAAVEGLTSIMGLAGRYDQGVVEEVIAIGDKSRAAERFGDEFEKSVRRLKKYVSKIGSSPSKLKDIKRALREEIEVDNLETKNLATNIEEASMGVVASDPRLNKLLEYRKGASDAIGAGDVIGALDLATNAFIPDFISYGLLVANRFKDRPLRTLQGTAFILDASSKAANAIRTGADKTLKSVTLGGVGPEYKKSTSILGKLLGQTGGITGTPYQVPSDEDYDKSVKKMREIQKDPEKLTAIIDKSSVGGQNLRPLRESLATTTSRAINYLGTFTPELAPASPFDRYDPVATPDMKMKYATAIEVLNNPINAYYYSLSNNLLDEQVLEPLRAIYPDTYARLQQQVLSTFVEARKSLPYATRVQLGMAYGQGMDPTVAPQFVGAMQQLYSPPGQERGGEVNMTQEGVGRLRKSAAEFTTPMQAIEGA